MRDDTERQRRFTETATQTSGNPAAQRDWAASLRDEDLTFYVERARTWANAPGSDTHALGLLASACEQVFGERNPDSM